jgi:rubredoxin
VGIQAIVVLGEGCFMHPKTHPKLMESTNRYFSWFGFFLILINIPVLVLAKYPYLFLASWVILVLSMILIAVGLPWKLPVYCETPNCHHEMKKEKVEIPGIEKAQLRYRCPLCGSVYETMIYSPKPSRDRNIPGEW